MGEIRLIIQPDETEAEAAQVFVDGTIDGHAYRFLLDTGAARTSVALDGYTATFPAVEKDSTSGVFAASSDDLITVPGIAVGAISRQNFTVARATERMPNATNLIGMDLLKDYRCHFRFDENRVVVDGTLEREADANFHELLFDRKFHPYLDVQFEGIRASAVWDTGASITVVDINFIQRYPAFFEAAGHSTGTDSTGTQVETPMFSMSAARIGPHIFPPHRVAGVDLSAVNARIEVPMDLILGYSTLSKANWLFDFPQQRWAITKWLG
ncbi:MAG: clan AA aspartic protease [Chloroflexi bacterium]|nr:clan AA aspartic protease [Chloroflexota bacterium]